MKWHNAVDMPNNPYAPEALKKRINGSQERCMDLPNISPGKETNPLEHITKEKLNDETDNKREIEYKRYVRVRSNRAFFFISSMIVFLCPF